MSVNLSHALAVFSLLCIALGQIESTLTFKLGFVCLIVFLAFGKVQQKLGGILVTVQRHNQTSWQKKEAGSLD